MTPLLSVDRLTVGIPVGGRWLPVVRDLSFDLDRGEILGLVGESGAGKSVTTLSVLGLPPAPGRILRGTVRLRDDVVVTADAEVAAGFRGARIGLVLQEASGALDPVFSIGQQLVEAVRAHHAVGRPEAHRMAAALLERVALGDADRILRAFPHQLSGGQRQRVTIALALAGEPEILIADEPTTALDVTIQAQILELLDRLRQDLDLAVLLITHDLAVVAETCDRAIVMYAGEAVESGPAARLFGRPLHPYTRALLEAVPHPGEPDRGLKSIPGRTPATERLPSGCPFHPRCDQVMAACRDRPPELVRVETGRWARCLLHEAAPEAP